MLIATSITQANERRQLVDVHGQEYLLREFVGAVPRRGTYVEGNETNDNGLPQGFLVSQPPGSVTPPHFHETNQFQVFVGGTGRLGKRRADPVTVQFAGGHTPYGPIAAEDRGIQYFTLRQAWDPGAKYMPAMRSRLVRGRQRQRLAARVERPAADLGDLPSPAVETLIPLEPDGMGRSSCGSGPGCAACTPAAAVDSTRSSSRGPWCTAGRSFPVSRADSRPPTKASAGWRRDRAASRYSPSSSPPSSPAEPRRGFRIQITPSSRRRAISASSRPRRPPRTSWHMLPEGRPEVVDPPRGPGEEGEDGGHGHLAGPLVLELEEVPPRRVLLVLEDVRDAVDRPAGHLARAAAGEHLGLGQGRGPLRHHLVHRRPVLEPVRDRPVAVGRGELRPAHRVRETLEHPVVGARDRHPLPVRGGVVAVGTTFTVSAPIRSRTYPVWA